MPYKARKPPTSTLPQKNAQTIESLKLEIANLQTEISSLKQNRGFKVESVFRSLVVFLLVTISLVSLFSLNLSFWAKDNVVNTDSFIKTASPIINDAAVQQLIASRLSDQLFENVNVEERLKQNLPENIQFLAPTLASQIQGVTKSQISNLLATDQVSTVWTKVLRNSHSSLIYFIENPNNDGVISVNELYSFVGQNSTNNNLSFLFNRQLPDRFGQIELRQVKWLPEARAYLNLVKRAPQLLAVVFSISLIGAVWLSRKKLRTLLISVILMTLTMIGSLWLIKVVASQIALAAKPENRAAVGAIYDILSSTLTSQTIGFAWLLGAISVGLLLASNFKFIGYTKKYIRHYLDKASKQIFPKFVVPGWLQQIETNRSIIIIVASLVWLVALALRIPPTKTGVMAAIWLSVATAFTVEVAASIARTGKK